MEKPLLGSIMVVGGSNVPLDGARTIRRHGAAPEIMPRKRSNSLRASAVLKEPSHSVPKLLSEPELSISEHLKVISLPCKNV
jgi:hypothetical protein